MGDSTSSVNEVASPTPVPRSTDQSGPIRVVIVDDHALVREGTLQLLEQVATLKVVGEAGTGEEGLSLIEHTRPDVALVDLNLPGMNGLDLARAVSAHFPQVRVLIVSAFDDYAYVSEALDIGVGGYLLKTASSRELVDAICAVADGVFVLDKAISVRLARWWHHGPADAAALTPRELDVLRLLTRGLSNKKIATELGLGLRTIEGHVSSVLTKLGVTSRTAAVLYALSNHLVAS